LSEIWGIGPVIAGRLYDEGVKSVEDLRSKQELLTDLQKIALKYYEDFKE